MLEMIDDVTVMGELVYKVFPIMPGFPGEPRRGAASVARSSPRRTVDRDVRKDSPSADPSLQQPSSLFRHGVIAHRSNCQGERIPVVAEPRRFPGEHPAEVASESFRAPDLLLNTGHAEIPSALILIMGVPPRRDGSA
jgi:hypothetical protein